VARCNEAAQLRAKAAKDARRQGCHDPLPGRRLPALPTIAHHFDRDPQVLHQNVFVARKREPSGTVVAFNVTSDVTTTLSRTEPRGRLRPFLPDDFAVAPSMPDGLRPNLGRGGRPFRRAISSFRRMISASFNANFATISCCSSTSAPCRRFTSPTSVSTTCRRSDREGLLPGVELLGVTGSLNHKSSLLETPARKYAPVTARAS